MTVEVRRGGDRFRTEQPGIVSCHSFSAGPHHDPGNVAFGPLIGYDEHVVAAGADFAMHAHRGVDILTWVIDGELTHADSLGNKVILRSGRTALLHAGSGVRHEERNDGDRPVRLIQATLLGGTSTPSYAPLRTTTDVGSCGFAMLTSDQHEFVLGDADLLHLFVARGDVSVESAGWLAAGDALRAIGPATVRATVSPATLAQVWTTTALPESPL